MRKKLWIALMLGVLVFLTQASMTYACHKELVAIRDEDGDGYVEVGEYVEFDMWIGISAWYPGDEDWTDIMVYDRIAAELDVISYEATIGEVIYCEHLGRKRKGATLIIWDVGDLTAVDDGGPSAFLYLTLATNLNPAGKQRYTSPGRYELNSGATLKCMIDGHQYSEDMNSLYIDVYEVWPPD